MERSSRAFNNIFFGFVFRFITIIGPFTVRIIVTWTLGREYLGISGVFLSIFSMLSITELGFASAITYRCYSLYAENNTSEICKYLNFFRNVYRGVGSVILIAGLCLIPLLKSIICYGVPSDINIYYIYLIYLFQTSVGYYIAAYRSVIFTMIQRQDYESKIASVCNVFMYILQIIILLMFKNYYIYLMMLPISTIIINITRVIVTNKYFPELKPIGMISKEDRYGVYKSILPLIGHRLHGTIVISADNIVLSAFIGVIVVAEYNNYFTIINALSAFAVAIYGAIQPGIGNSMATETMDKNYNDFCKISFAMVWIIGWMSICCICLFQDFIEIAYGKESVLDFSTVVLLVILFYIWRTFDIVMTYRDVVGCWGGDTLIPYISGIVNLVSNIVLVRFIGLKGVVISTLLTFVLFTIPNSIRVLFKKVFHMPIKNYMLKYLLNTLCIVCVGLITYLLCGYICIESIIVRLVMKCIACAIFPNIILWLLWREKEEYLYFSDKVISNISVKRMENPNGDKDCYY